MAMPSTAERTQQAYQFAWRWRPTAHTEHARLPAHLFLGTASSLTVLHIESKLSRVVKLSPPNEQGGGALPLERPHHAAARARPLLVWGLGA